MRRREFITATKVLGSSHRRGPWREGRMQRREFVRLLGASAALPFAAVAQEPGRTYRLGCLLPLTRDAPVNVAFLDVFRRRGFVEGQNLIVEWRAYGLHPDL